MIGHKNEEVHEPITSGLTELNGLKQRARDRRVAELILGTRVAAKGDEEDRIGPNPRWRVVGQ